MTSESFPLRRVRVHFTVLCIGAWVAAFALTHVPAKALPKVGVKDVALHAVGYLAITGIFLLALCAHGFRRRRRAALALGAMLAYAALDELTQPLVGRSAAFGDWAADAAGAAAAIVVVELALAIVSRTRRAAQCGHERGR